MMRKGFSLIIAIAFLVAVAIVGTLTMMTVAVSTKETKNLYLYEQAQLYARSAAEYAILKIQSHDFSSGKCLNEVNIYFDGTEANGDWLFKAETKIKYIGHGSIVNKCENYISDGKDSASDDKISAVVLYIRVESNDDLGGEKVSYSRVTTQIP